MKYVLPIVLFLTGCSTGFYPHAQYKVGWMAKVVAGIHKGEKFLIQDRQYEPSCVDGIAYDGELQNQYKELATICQEELVAIDE